MLSNKSIFLDDYIWCSDQPTVDRLEATIKELQTELDEKNKLIESLEAQIVEFQRDF